MNSIHLTVNLPTSFATEHSSETKPLQFVCSLPETAGLENVKQKKNEKTIETYKKSGFQLPQALKKTLAFIEGCLNKMESAIDQGIKYLGLPLKVLGAGVMLAGAGYLFFILFTTLSVTAAITSGALLVMIVGALLYQLGKDLRLGNDSSGPVGNALYLPTPIKMV